MPDFNTPPTPPDPNGYGRTDPPGAAPLPCPPALTSVPPDSAGVARPAQDLAAPAGATPAPAGAGRPSRSQAGLWGTLIPLAIFLAVVLCAAYTAPAILVQWRLAPAQAEAEATYLKRQAELKAEAEAAEHRLNLLDKRTHLTSLGFREVVRKVTPAVVNVTSYREPPAGADAPAQRHLFYDAEKDRRYLQAGVGSGLIVKPGFVLTNAHVVRGAERLQVTFASGRSVGVDPERVAEDAMTDLAVIRLPQDPPANLRADYDRRAEFADSDKDVERGDLVLAVGSPLGLKQTVTHGIISAKGRLLTMLDTVELLQTDTPINPGNSGGPLFDQYGRVAGINVAIASDTGRSEGIGFVIPSNTAHEIFAKLVAKGEVVRGFIGATLEEVTADRAPKLGLKKDQAGVLITRVVPDFPAAKAGVRPGDVVVAYDKAPLGPNHAARELRQRILDTRVGRRVPVEVLRGGARRTLTVEIGRRPARLP
jgi:serine protease DegS